MWNRAKPRLDATQSTWGRELVQPAVTSLVILAIMVSQFVGSIAQIAMGPITVFIGILVLTWIFPRLMTSGSKLSRTTTKPAPNFIAKSRLQTVANGDYGPLDPEYQPLKLTYLRSKLLARGLSASSRLSVSLYLCFQSLAG
ncbi:hypothetical protein GCM10009093_15220 [Brevundimonas terrae]|uniref:Uncharacterized protein n=1 Tax=Brevundimonas terrae TaxID=363631 RepID=A0ABN0YAY7_9CAUL|nr:hypothetical protein [Brevundimonas terrae]